MSHTGVTTDLNVHGERTAFYIPKKGITSAYNKVIESQLSPHESINM